jgi:hypothetical protein
MVKRSGHVNFFLYMHNLIRHENDEFPQDMNL